MIAPMKKVSIVCMKEDREKVLTSLQHSALMMITASDTGVPGGDKESSERQRRVEQLLGELNKFGKKKGLFEQPAEVDRKDFDNVSDDTVALCEKIENLVERRNEVTTEINSLNALIESLQGWETLDVVAEDLRSTDSAEITTGRVPVKNYVGFFLKMDELGVAHEVVSENEKTVQVLLIYHKDIESSVRSALIDSDFEEVRLPMESGTVKEFLDGAAKRLEPLTKENAEISAKLGEIAKESKTDVETLFEQYRSIADRAEVRLNETVETVFIEGWARADSTEKLEKVLKEAVDAYGMETRDPKEDEEVPTSLTNGKYVSQFEGITEMFNPPKYTEFDPNAVMAPWYWVIFGMMMGDAGYGLMMAVLIFAAKKLMKPKGGMEKLMNVLLYSSITTIIFGVLFGSYFGEELFKPLIGFTAMGDPIKMLLFTLIVGVLHIFTGMITKIVLNVKSGHPLDAIFDQVSWMMIIAGLGMVFLPPLSKVGIVLAIIGAVIVLFTAGREKKGIVGKITGGLGGLYGVTSYLSDILSYSRILALGLATGVVGMVMNLLAGMVQNGVIGFILSLVIYIVGHIFNLVLGLLSAYVHSCRLQYIEFYGKFYEGGGTVFKPFGIKTNYINIKKD